MTMRTKYVNEMNEIKVDDELKQTIINNASMSTAVLQRETRAFRRKVAMIAVSCIAILLLAIGGPLILHDKNHDNPSTLFSGFVITAYAADGAPLVVKPDVDFPLGQYSSFMSSVPGFPVTIVSKEADKIEVRTSEGELLLWDNKEDFKVRSQGKVATFKSGDTIYWTPVVVGDQKIVDESILEISAYKDMKKLGSSKIEIKLGNHNMYNAKLINE
ncbi:hypothetical protein ACP26L_01140 [Paenibacillus sp. S-38]|uniref:hypothetical protein n=1 Tax=Paenibacillus sp. S-38 TaxID=3416710 RepID=UPI003CF771FC